ncbi:hypothetical protein AMQ83_10010 [Paenibacillus riograndensis]|nr:hypothetical protein AMQ83_10010 [Paenibacillus riograndensis]
MKWELKNRKSKKKVIFTPFNYTPLSLGIFVASKITRIKRANVFTDLSSDIINKERQGDMIILKKIILPFYIKFVKFVERNFDLYVLFTESMNSIVNTKDKPYVVMEGIFYNDFDLSPEVKTKSIMYAGTLSYEYGVGIIIEAFLKLPNSDVELWLFGDGNMKDFIENLSLENEKIRFFGFKSPKEVFKYEKMATLLINIRNPHDQYTKYSFPSKTFEYMVSGTPFLSTKLEGIPSEYYEYMYTVDSHDTSVVKEKIVEILNNPQTDLDEIGGKARAFIIKNKNSKMQLNKVIDLLNKNI